VVHVPAPKAPAKLKKQAGPKKKMAVKKAPPKAAPAEEGWGDDVEVVHH
jgi:hypothetical protein